MFELTDSEQQILESAVGNNYQEPYSKSDLESMLDDVQSYNPPMDRESLRWSYGSLVDKLETMIQERQESNQSEVPR